MFRYSIFGMILLTAVTSVLVLSGQEKSADKSVQDKSIADKNAADKAAKLTEPTNATRLAQNYDIWIDTKRKIVIVDGKVALREGPLEMFACSKGTKEHESVVAVQLQGSI